MAKQSQSFLRTDYWIAPVYADLMYANDFHLLARILDRGMCHVHLFLLYKVTNQAVEFRRVII